MLLGAAIRLIGSELFGSLGAGGFGTIFLPLGQMVKAFPLGTAVSPATSAPVIVAVPVGNSSASRVAPPAGSCTFAAESVAPPTAG